MALGDLFPSFQSRRARPSLIMNGVDILLGLAAQNILSFSYTDNTSDQADDLSIEIADPKRSWMQRYMPKKGVEVQASIFVTDWAAPFDNRELRCGTFFIDNVGMHGPPNVVSIKAVSIPINTGFKNEKRTKSWENSDLQSIAGQIASQNNLTLFYDTGQNPTVKRTDQVEKADVQYLRERAKDSSLSLKVHDKKLVVYSEKEYEARAAVFTIVYGSSNVLGWDFNSKSDDTYSSAQNAYVNPETGKLTKTGFTPGKGPEGVNSKLNLNERIDYDKDGKADYGLPQRMLRDAGSGGLIDYALDSPAQNAGKGNEGQARSTEKSQAKLREKNKKENTATLTVAGNILYLSGLNFQLVGWGIFDDKWFSESTVHAVADGGYTTQLKLRIALQGY